MKICLINPTISQKRMWNQSIQHIGIAYIAAVLHENGFTVDVIDCPSMDMGIRDVIRQIKEQKYDVIGISLYFYNKLAALKIVKTLSAYMDCFLYFGGYYPTLNAEETYRLFPEANCLVIGEGERTTLELMTHLKNKTDWHDIPGIAYRNNNALVTNPPSALIPDLDMLPFPIRPSNIDMRYLPVVTSRGCYGRCTFCGVKEFYMCNTGAKRRFRSVVNVIDEIEELLSHHRIDCIIVNDETFFDASPVRKTWLETFIKELDQHHIEVDFQCQARANDVIYNFDLIKSMKDHGMTRLFIGIESFIQRQLDLYQKDLSVETNIQAIQLLHQLDMQTQIFVGFIFLDPLITADEILSTITTIRNLGLCSLVSPEEQQPFSMSILLLIEGTPLYDIVHEQGLSRDNARGYIFKDKDIECLYQILLLCWHPSLDQICNNMFHIFHARIDNPEIYKNLKSLKQEFLELDLEFMEHVCVAVKAGKRDISDMKVEPILTQIKVVSDKFMEELARLEIS